jgi:ABC-type antimicrobial peptide transport system, permease component
MLFKLALSNIKRRFQNYWAYYLSSTFGVFVLYLFLSITYNKLVSSQLGSVVKFSVLFNIGSVLTALFAAFFVWYSNSFFIKSREKEFATYMLLGMSKRQTIRLNFFENSFVLALAFCTGIAAGILLNKVVIMALFAVMGMTGSVPFEISIKAIGVCSVIYGSVFILISIHSAVLLHRNSLINLINANKKAESGLKISILTALMCIASVISLSYGYYLAVKKALNPLSWPVTVILVSVGTVLLFTSLASFIIWIVRKNEKRLFKGTKLITVSQLFFRYKGNVGTLSVIAITTTVALCTLLTCYGPLSSAVENSHNMRPFSVEYMNVNNTADKTFEDVLENHSEIKVKSKNIIKILSTRDKDAEYYAVSESDYNKLNKAQSTGIEVSLQDDGGCYYIKNMDDKSDTGKKITLGSAVLTVVNSSSKWYIALDHFTNTLVVRDSVYQKIKGSSNVQEFSITGYELQNDMISRSFIADLNKKMPSDISMLTFYDHLSDSIKLEGMMFFIGMFIGLLFLMATGSIIYFKMSMEASEDRDKFITLRRIGVRKDELKGAIAKELGVIFGAPFVVASANAFAATFALQKLAGLQLKKAYIVVILIYLVLYMSYYFITLNSYTKAVVE